MGCRILWLEFGDLYTMRRGREAGARRGIQVETLDVMDLVFFAGPDGSGITSRGEGLIAKYDGVIVRSFMPFISEVLTLARLFHEAGKFVVDESLTTEGYAISKMHDYLVLNAAGIHVPCTYQAFDQNEAEKLAGKVGYPCVLKGIQGSEGRHVHKVDTSGDLRKRWLRYPAGQVMVQEYLPAEEDYRVMVVGYRALPVYVSRRPRAGDFRTNFDLNEEVGMRHIADSPPLGQVAEQASHLLRREFAGVDIRFRGEVPMVLEVNRRPGFRGFEEATGFDVAGALVEYAASKCANRPT